MVSHLERIGPMSVRVRYAPSPTGEPHVGNIRTAIFNWLFARHHGGVFILRIEDTDQARTVEVGVEGILESLRWLQLDLDEGPYYQSQRLELYRGAAERLLGEGQAYHCYCSPQRLEEMRLEQQRRKEPLGYDRKCRNLSEKERKESQEKGITPVVRFAMPLEGQTSFRDVIRGQVSFENRLLDDFIILKSDGFPTYHLANVVDDHAMEISHVMRAEEWLPSTPRHLQIYQALGYEPPLFAHLPMILGSDRSKLSKRHGATSLLEYREMGYLPEAVLNFLTLLGWSLDETTEIMDREEFIRHFSLERIGKPGAIFSTEKLTWMNGYYIRQLSQEELAQRLIPFLERPPSEGGLPAEAPRPIDLSLLRQVVPLIQERIKTLGEASELIAYFFTEELEHEQEMLLQKGMTLEGTVSSLEAALACVESVNLFEAEGLENALRPLAQELGLKAGQLFGALRVATTGRDAAPPLFATMEVIGRQRCLGRIAKAVQLLGKQG